MSSRKYKAFRDDPNAELPARTQRRMRDKVRRAKAKRRRLEIPTSARNEDGDQRGIENAFGEDLMGGQNVALVELETFDQASANPCTSSDLTEDQNVATGIGSEFSGADESFEVSMSFEDQGVTELLDEAQTINQNGRHEENSDLKAETEFLTCDGEKLFPGSPVSRGTCHLLVMTYAIKHSLTQSALEDLVKLIDAICPSGHKCAASAYLIKKDFSDLLYKDPPPTVYYCCPCCHKPLESKDAKCDIEECMQDKEKPVEFYHMDIEAQLQRFFKDSTFRKNINTGHISEDGTIRDIYDGQAYRSMTRPGGFLHETGNLTFTFNTDGVRIFQSSRKGELWPAYLAINELPPSLRFSKKFLILAGFWCSKGKPTMLTFLRPLMKTLNKIYTEGFVVRDTVTNTERIVRGLLLLCSVDLPAKAILANTKQYNGAFGCNNCEDEGKSLKAGHRIWPYEGPVTLRTHSKYREYLSIVQASATGNKPPVPHKGIKGPCVLLLHEPFDMQAFVVDWMHGVPLGVLKTLASMWMGERNEVYYIGNKLPLLDERLLGLQIPDDISHAPRSLADIQKWKASPLRDFLLHFSLVVLRGELNLEHYAHYTLLVEALSTLVSEAITDEQLHKAEIKLDVFCRTFEDLYGESAQTMNVHLLRHLPHFVRLYGPLFAYSCFGFETFNGHIKRMVHGTTLIVNQITFTAAMTVNLQRLVKAMDPARDSTKAVKLAKKLAGYTGRKKMTELTPGVYSLGVRKDLMKTTVDQEIVSALQQRTGTRAGPKCEVFYRVCLDILPGQTIKSRGYGREKARNNRTVQFSADGRLQYGEVLLFCSTQGEDLAVLKLYEQVDEPIINVDEVTNASVREALGLQMQSFVIQVVETNMYSAVPICDIHKKCICMEVREEQNTSMYIGLFPNTCEMD
ncbi:Hypp2800 [Branchiostoma lanceolatum]|uniref:Hypp2800 protein n=1 Tax=Branchiostoma lanceolatum TaxID=7740 RepID=A0A8J9ZW30_BRALA|nr:Hypp2800 [Branchiostoma lanceolatum]